MRIPCIECGESSLTPLKGSKWYSLIDKVQSETTLQSAFTEVATNKGAAGVDHVSVERFAQERTRICGA